MHQIQDENRPALAHPEDVFRVIKDDSPLSLFCQAHPKATVLLRFRIISNAWANYFLWINKMLAWQKVLRGCITVRAPQHFLDHFNELSIKYSEILEGSELVKKLPQNLRISIMDRWESAPEEEMAALSGREHLPNVREVLEDAEKAFLEGL
jgi:hypothetical protein